MSTISASLGSLKTIQISSTAPGGVTFVQIGTAVRLLDGSDILLTVPNFTDIGGITVSGTNAVTISIPVALAVGKSFSISSGSVIATADSSLDFVALTSQAGKALNVSTIQLATTGDYTLTYDQALISRVGNGGTVKTLTGTGKITVNATSSAGLVDLTQLKTDSSASFLLSNGGQYTITSDQAKNAKIGASLPGDLTNAGLTTILANASADLTGLTTTSNETFWLAAGKDYKLTLAQANTSQVGLNGTLKDLTLAGNITVLSPSTPKTLVDLSSTTVKGIDIFQLSAGGNYVISASQAASSRVGETGSMGNLALAGAMTIKAHSDYTNLSTLTTDANDTFQLDKGVAYTLNTSQLSKSQIVNSNLTLGALGVLAEAGLVTAIANPAGENLASLAATGVSAFQLSQGKDYVLTSAQALMSTVIGGGGQKGDFTLAGNITLKALTPADGSGEDLSRLAGPVNGVTLSGVDIYSLAAGQRYTMTAAQAATARIDANGTAGVIGNLLSAGAITIDASAAPSPTLASLKLDGNDKIYLGESLDYTLNAQEVLIASIKGNDALPGNLSRAGTITVVANPLGEDLSFLKDATGVDIYVLAARQKYTLTPSQAQIAQVAALRSLASAGSIVIKADSGENLVTSLNGVTGVKAIQLNAGQDYTLSTTQAFGGHDARAPSFGPHVHQRPGAPGVVCVVMGVDDGVHRLIAQRYQRIAQRRPGRGVARIDQHQTLVRL